MKNEFAALANNAQWSEKAIEQYLVRKMKDLGGKALKYSSATKSGYPDRICLFPDGKVAFIELKGKRGKLSEQQLNRIEELQRMNFTALVLYSKDEVDLFIKGMTGKLESYDI